MVFDINSEDSIPSDHTAGARQDHAMPICPPLEKVKLSELQEVSLSNELTYDH